MLALPASALELGWTAEPMSASGDTIRTDGELVYSYSILGEEVNGVKFSRTIPISNAQNIEFSAAAAGSKYGDFGNEGLWNTYGNMLSHASYWDGTTSELTLTLKGLTAGKSYLVQIVSHQGNGGNGLTISANGTEPVYVGTVDGDKTYRYGASIVGCFSASAATDTVTLTFAASDSIRTLNAIQVREVELGPTVSDPEIGEVSVVVNSTIATIGLEGVKMGTDDEAVPATSYSVSYSLDDGDPQKALENQTGETASFDIAGLTEGDHSCSVTITSDKGKTSAAKAVAFTVKIEIVDPSIGSVTAQTVGSTATITLADIVRGTDAAGNPATMYSVYYKLNGGESVLALENQTAASVDFTIESLEDGDYSCAVWIVTDKETTSEAKSANFKINTSIGDFDALKAAIEGAAAGATIVVERGLYTATSTITVNANDITIVSRDGKAVTVLDAEGKCRLWVIKGTNCRIEGLTFKNSFADNAYGGAMDISGNARAKIVNCDFIGCKAKWGGAICCGDNGHSAFDIRENYTIVSECAFLECGVAKMGDGWGGGGAIYGAVWAEDSVFDACFTEAGGGLLYHADIDATSYMTATNCDFKNHNQANRGLVGINENRQGQGAVRLVDCLFAANTATSADSILFHRRVMLDRCVISNNMSTVETALTPLFRELTEECKVRNCLFVDNQAPYEMNGNLMPLLENCTFVRNVGGLALNYNDSVRAPQIKNCVFWGNLPNTKWPNGATFYGVPGFYWHGGVDAKLKGFAPFVHTVVEGGSANAKVKELLEAETDQVSIALTTKADTDGRVFVDLEGGNYEPAPRSALIDGGVMEDWMTGAKDLAGNPRAKDGKVDLGCYERKATGMLVILR